MKGLCRKVVEERLVSDRDSSYVGYLRWVPVDLWIYSAKWKKLERKTGFL